MEAQLAIGGEDDRGGLRLLGGTLPTVCARHHTRHSTDAISSLLSTAVTAKSQAKVSGDSTGSGAR